MPSGKRHYRLTFADALGAHERALRTGGRDGIPNPTLVESAIARPYSGYYRPIARKAAALTQSMATNHGFADGNKRTTIILTHLLVTRSEYELAPLEGDIDLATAMETLVLAVVEDKLPFDDIVDWFRARLQKRE